MKETNKWKFIADKFVEYIRVFSIESFQHYDEYVS